MKRQALMPSDWGEASHTRPSRIIDAGSARRKLFIGHIRKVERFAAVRERDPGIAQACKVLALVIIVRFFGQSRHSSGRFPCGVALLHVVGSVLASRKHNTPRLAAPHGPFLASRLSPRF